MKQKVVLLVAILLSVTAAAEESGANKPVKGSGHIEEKADPPAKEHKLDFKELFGCEPMGEEGHKPPPEPAPAASRQETPTPERGSMQ